MKLTQEQKRIKLAEANGINIEEYRMEEGDINTAPLPAYFNDLNAVHELEKVLTDKQWLEYREELRTVSLGPIRLVSQWCKADIHATATQRSEAIGKTLGLW
jgi:hypothetical protein